MSGEFDEPLLAATHLDKPFEEIKKIQIEKVYTDNHVLRVEVAGYKVISGLLESFVSSVFDIHEKKNAHLERAKRFLI